ncbi:hypothetical protein [Gracilimonas sp.]|uniref:hypothetical protein n=1 Tax=Gracilimonas sp. TaxID=1974203 RepID=UPI0028714266|nr:hypothetical protein [Gracilimonas sp.]
MMRTVTTLFISLFILLGGVKETKAQTMELLAGNTLNGAISGTLLGGATMGLTGNSDFTPLRVGLGLGTLYGIGVGALDVAEGEGNQILVSGLFNDGTNTSIIVLLDTFYGIGAGAVVATSVMLIANEPLVHGLRYGASAGAWIGFGVGLVDAFMYSERTVSSSPSSGKVGNVAGGLIGIQFSEKASAGLISPSQIETLEMRPNGISQKLSASIDFINLKISF